MTKEHLQRLNALMALKEDSKFTTLAWLRDSPGAAKARHILEHIERLKAIRSLDLPVGLDKMIHQNRLLKLAREGRQMITQVLSVYAYLVGFTQHFCNETHFFEHLS